jgi:hypothetical protein
MDLRNCPHCLSRMPFDASRCPQCTSFSDPPELKKDDDMPYLIILVIIFFVMAVTYRYIKNWLGF